MQLQGRKLLFGLEGHDVKLLQEELIRLGFEIPHDETRRTFFGPKTKEVVLLFQEKHDLEPNGIVNNETAALINNELTTATSSSVPREFTVTGRVAHTDDKPYVGGMVRAFDKDLRSEELLGIDTTNLDGTYEITYTKEAFKQAENTNADLRVCVCNPQGRELVSSPILFNAGPQEAINLVVPQEKYSSPSEYEELVTRLTPLLQGLSFSELTEDKDHQDISFLSNETKVLAAHLTFLVLAHRFKERTHVAEEIWYALLRQGLPTELHSILSAGEEAQRNAIEISTDRNIIPLYFRSEIDKTLERLKELVVESTVDQSSNVPSNIVAGPALLLPIIGTVIPEKEKQKKFLMAYINKNKGLIKDFWESLRNDSELKNNVDDLQFTLQVGTLTNNNLSLVKKLQRMRQNGEIANLSDLARFDYTKWKAMILDELHNNNEMGFPPGVPGKNDEEKAANYAVAIVHMVEDSFPTQFAVQQMMNERDDEESLPEKHNIIKFIENNPQFNLKTTRLSGYLSENPSALDNIPGPEDRRNVLRKIGTIQRLYKVAPRYGGIRELMKVGFESAHSIALTGRNTFIAKYGVNLGGEANAKKIHESALRSQAMAISILAEYGPMSNALSMAVFNDHPPTSIDGVPEWSTLFGALDLCQCSHCKSVLSPAAYLVDILHFLKSRPSKIGKDISVKDVLFYRRADISEIELTCENTNTPLPYVDLVNEILEDAVSPFPPFEGYVLDAALGEDLNNQALTEALRNAFHPPLSPTALITVGAKASPRPLQRPWWLIDDEAYTYRVQNEEDDQLHVVTRSRQTRMSADECAANPQYINSEAYKILRRSVFPWKLLPFDLWREETNTYLDHLGITRHEIMETFFSGSGDLATILNDAAIAKEYIGISLTEAGIITGTITSDPDSPSPGLWNLWGFEDVNLSIQNSIVDPSDSTKRITSGIWTNVIGTRIDVFLQQSGLKYTELLNLLGTYLVNPSVVTGAHSTRQIQIVSTDAENPHTCELNKLALDGIDEEAIVKIVRFVRLWRKLKWSMYDLDRSITALGSSPQVLNEQFIVDLANIQRLHNELNEPIVSLITWWGPLDNFDALHSVWNALYLEYSSDSGDPYIVPSLYNQIFKNRTITNPADPAFTDPKSLSGTLTDNASTIFNSLGISAADFELILDNPHIIPRDSGDSTRPDDTLTLKNLSLLYRHTRLAKALRLSVEEYLIALDLINSNPFISTTETILFADTIDKLRQFGITINEIDYLLRHNISSSRSAALAPSDEYIALILDEIRGALQDIAAENTLIVQDADGTTISDSLIEIDPNNVTSDPDGTLTSQKLALLDWRKDIIDQIVATLNGMVMYETELGALVPSDIILPNYSGAIIKVPLAALPDDFEFPSELRDVISYDIQTHELKTSRILTPPERTLLKEVAATAPTDFTGEVEELFALQDGLQGEIRFNAEVGRLQFTGVMTKARRDRLLVASADPDYQTAITSLFDKPRQFISRHMRAFSFNSTRQFLAVYPNRFSSALDTLAADIKFPKTIKDQIYLDTTVSGNTQLRFIGIMTESERDLLLSLSDPADPNHTEYRAAIEDLYNQADALTIEPRDVFLSISGPDNDIATMFDDYSMTPADRFLVVLKKLLPYLKQTLGEQIVKQKIGEALGLDFALAEFLLTEFINSTADPSRKSISEFVPTEPEFSARVFSESNTNIKLTRTSFPAQFETFELLYKVAMIVSKLQIKSTRQITWLFDYGNDVGWLDLNTLPIRTLSTDHPPASLHQFIRLVDLFHVRERLPQGELALDEIFELQEDTPSSDLDVVLKKVSEYTKWNLDDLEYLASAKGFDVPNSFPSGFQDERLFLRLLDAFTIINRLKMSAEQCNELSQADLLDEIARSVKQSVRAKYDQTQWLTVARPLRDKLRDKQRAALVEYLVAHLKEPLPILESPHPPDLHEGSERPAVWELQQKLNASGISQRVDVNGSLDSQTRDAVIAFQQHHGLNDNGIVDHDTWALLDDARRRFRNVNDLFMYYLIDVEMSSCMLTSRIKQALSSTQLYVQRCLLNLESDVSATIEDFKWNEWKWMKNYRVWEANRKVFLYPENWVEPELRDDKTPIFKELEGELMQSDLNNETAEEAYMNYLEKLDEIAYLQIVGMYHQIEKNEYDETIMDILHVFGRTYASPPTYFYRRRMDSAYWTAWEKVDLDIEGDTLLPVIWNRRLYLFWPTVMEKAEPVDMKMPETGENVEAEPKKYWELGLAWSEYSQGKWKNKKTSSSYIRIPSIFLPYKSKFPPYTQDQIRSWFVFRAGFVRNNDLSIFCFIDNLSGGGPRGRLRDALDSSKVMVGHFTFSGCNSDPERYDFSFSMVIDPVYNVLDLFFLRAFSYNNNGGMGWIPWWQWCHGLYGHKLVLPQPLSGRGEGDVLASPGVHNLLVPHDGSQMVDHPLFFMPFAPRRIFFITSSLGHTMVGDANECVICSGDPGITSIISNAYYRELRTPVAPVGSYSPTNSVRFEHSLPVNPVEDIADRVVSSNTPIVPTIPSDGSTIVSLIERETLPGADRLLTGRSDSRLVSLHPNTRLTALLTGDSSASANELFVTTDSTVIKYRHQYHFQIFYHPYVCDFVRELNRYGVKGILNREIQLNPTRTSSSLDFKDDYEPLPLEYNIPAVSEPYPEEDVDFTYPGAYSQYNWELFFHIPLMLADRLSKNQRFEEAQKWFHYIFNPTDSSTLPLPQRYWITKPFYNATKADYKKERIENLLRLLAVGGDPVRFSELSDKEKEELKEIENTVTEWRRHPFKPHLIARMRNTAYQKTVVMKYIDNLIAWGDRLFSRDTIESINEAAQLYVLAADILGHRPEEVLGRGQPSVQTYNSLEPKLGSFSNALVQAEELISPSSSFSSSFPFVGIGSYTNIVIGGENVNGNENIPRSPYVSATDLVVNENDEEPPVTLSTIVFFCAPKNDKLLEYWDIVSDRLFKIRHCMNIEGIVRQLALFEPPIDPALLVKAAAAGVDITTILNDITGAMPHYKFRVLVQKASELCAEVKSLGSAILATLEKKDAEHLAMIRAEHESTLLSMIESVKTQLIDEASENKEALRKSRAIAITRYSQHANMVDGGIHTVPAEGNDVPFVLSNTSHTILEEEEGVKMIPHEKSELWNLRESRSREEAAHGLNIAAAIAHAVPNFNLEPFGIGATFGGSNIGSALSAGANIASTLASKYTFEATLKAKLVQAIMRAHDHSMQSNIAATEIMHIDKQIQLAQLRKEITEKELANHKRQIENAKEIEEIMRIKYTNQELYSWMVGQLSGLYFQSYQIAYEVAKRAESAFRFELGLTDSNFIQFGYWDNLKRGLLAGEKLYHDIQRMEVAYLDKNKREYEITKHFSLAMLDPVALTQLKQTGECFISLPEVLFDMDYPGHYMRRIKSVSLTIPCVTGPYVGVNCTLTLIKNSIRHNNTLNGGKYARIEEGDDPRFTDSNGAVQSIVTSSGQNDSGLFETNLNDERYLPFEWAGAISQWHLKLPTDFRQFDYDTIVTVVLHMLYTARPAGGLLEDQAKVELQETINEFLRAESQKGLALSFSLRHEFSTEWHRFLSQPSESQEGHRKMTITLDMDRFPFMVHDRTISITKIELLVKVRSGTEENFPSTHNESTLKLSLRSGPEAEEPPADGAEDIMALALWNGLLRGITSEGGEPGQWNLWAWFDSGGGVEELNKDAIEDIVIICHYTLG